MAARSTRVVRVIARKKPKVEIANGDQPKQLRGPWEGLTAEDYRSLKAALSAEPGKSLQHR